MKVFISWSGTTSQKVALILRDWLPSVIQSIDPYVSSKDIDKGARWSTDIAGELDASDYGILCLTPDNLVAPWINFEAGALGKSVDKSRVSPLLFRVKRTDVQGPLVQFQSTTVERDEVWELMNSINNACGEAALDEARLGKAFQTWWPQLEKELGEIPEEAADKGEDSKAASPAEITKILEELLDLARTNTKLLREPGMSPPRELLDELHVAKVMVTQYERVIENFGQSFRTIKNYISANVDDLTVNQASVELLRMIEVFEPSIPLGGRSTLNSWLKASHSTGSYTGTATNTPPPPQNPNTPRNK